MVRAGMCRRAGPTGARSAGNRYSNWSIAIGGVFRDRFLVIFCSSKKSLAARAREPAFKIQSARRAHIKISREALKESPMESPPTKKQTRPVSIPLNTRLFPFNNQ